MRPPDRFRIRAISERVRGSISAYSEMSRPYRLAQLSVRYALLPMQVSKKPTDPADAVMREIEEMGKKSFIPSIGPVKGKILAEVVRKLKPRKILEVGSLYGYSAILITKNSQ